MVGVTEPMQVPKSDVTVPVRESFEAQYDTEEGEGLYASCLRANFIQSFSRVRQQRGSTIATKYLQSCEAVICLAK